MASNSYAVNVLQLKLTALQNRLKTVLADIDYCPAMELVALRTEVMEKINSFDDKCAPELMKWMEEASQKEKRLRKQMIEATPAKDKKLWDKRLEIETNIADLQSAIYRLSRL